jgi:hypothetical protein
MVADRGTQRIALRPDVADRDGALDVWAGDLPWAEQQP